MRNDRGAVLPLAFVFLGVLVVLAAYIGREMVTGTVKVRRQRETDEMAMILANDQARALNALAHLNWTLEIVRQRKTVYKTATYLAFALMLVEIRSGRINGPFQKMFRRLVRGWDPFMNRIKSLSRTVVKQQEQILRWAEVLPARAIALRNLRALHRALRDPKDPAGISWAFLSPEKPSLLAERPGGDEGDLAKPLSLREDFASEQHVLISTVSVRPSARISALMRGERPNYSSLFHRWAPVRRHPSLWSVSEARSTGKDLSLPSFHPALAAIAHLEPAWKKLRTEIPGLPRFEEFRDEIEH